MQGTIESNSQAEPQGEYLAPNIVSHGRADGSTSFTFGFEHRTYDPAGSEATVTVTHPDAHSGNDHADNTFAGTTAVTYTAETSSLSTFDLSVDT